MEHIAIDSGFFAALKQVQDAGAALTGDRYLAAMKATRRVHDLLHTPTSGIKQDELLLSAAVRELEQLKRTTVEGMTGNALLAQAEEAGLVHIFMRCAALAGSLNRSLERTRRKEIVQNWQDM